MDILIAGDLCPQNRVTALLEQGRFEDVLGEVKPILSRFDYRIVNFECPIIKGDEKPILKQGPNLSCSEKGVELLKWAGFDCVTLANNHFYDYGNIGVNETLLSLDKAGIDHVGGGRNNQDASIIHYKRIGENVIGIINCCEHEFSIATETTGGANPLNVVQQTRSLKEAKSKADFVIVIVHGGFEHFQLPSPRMKETYRFFIEMGADTVINHHQHCFSGYELYKGKPIFYGLGNFCFDRASERNSIWNEGYMISISFKEKQDPKFKIFPYIQCGENPGVRLMNDEERHTFDMRINDLNDVISNDELLRVEHENWMRENSRNFLSIFQPYNIRILNSLYVRGLLPSFINKKKQLRIIDYINCESHLDKLRFLINELQ